MRPIPRFVIFVARNEFSHSGCPCLRKWVNPLRPPAWLDKLQMPRPDAPNDIKSLAALPDCVSASRA